MAGKGQGFFPMFRWFSAITIAATIYLAYGMFSPVIDTTLPNAASDLGVNAQGLQAITDTGTSFYTALLILMIGMGLYMFLSGIPMQQEERRIGP